MLFEYREILSVLSVVSLSSFFFHRSFDISIVFKVVNISLQRHCQGILVNERKSLFSKVKRHTSCFFSLPLKLFYAEKTLVIRTINTIVYMVHSLVSTKMRCMRALDKKLSFPYHFHSKCFYITM